MNSRWLNPALLWNSPSVLLQQKEGQLSRLNQSPTNSREKTKFLTALNCLGKWQPRKNTIKGTNLNFDLLINCTICFNFITISPITCYFECISKLAVYDSFPVQKLKLPNHYQTLSFVLASRQKSRRSFHPRQIKGMRLCLGSKRTHFFLFFFDSGQDLVDIVDEF